MSSQDSKSDYLTEDSTLPNDQKFVCLSFLTDKDNKTTLSGLKIRGVFPTYELACEHAKRVQTVDPYFNVFVGDMGKWLPFDPNPESQAVKDSEYANDELNKMMKAYIENQEKAKIFHEQRKTELVRKNVMDNLATRRDNMDELEKRRRKAKTDNERENLDMSMKALEEQIKKMEDKKRELDEQLQNYTTQLSGFTKSEYQGPKEVGN
jgi:molecular chaperone DnaK (HSP70)